VFQGENDGLIIAEIELSSEEEPFDRPGWLGREVSGDPRYFNSELSKRPFGYWDAP
jgi:CYTH domain-containing protein